MQIMEDLEAAGAKVITSGAQWRSHIDETMTLEQLQHEFDDHMRMWQASTCRVALLNILDEYKTTFKGEYFDKIVCLAGGTFCTRVLDWHTPGSSTWRDRSLYQMACVIDVAEYIRQRDHDGASN